jgi:hypothetical protein
LLIGLIVAAGACFAGVSSAQTGEWAATHPRRVEVNSRLALQSDRIHQQVAHGDMSYAEAGRLHCEDRQIRTEERDMASQGYSHLTRVDQRALNQQENRVNRQIGD